MAISSGDGWFAVFSRTDGDTNQLVSLFYNPIIVWQENCANPPVINGLVVQDRNGYPLPFPVAAPDVFGFEFYAKGDAGG